MSRLPRPTTAYIGAASVPIQQGSADPLAPGLGMTDSLSSDAPPARIKPKNPFASPQRGRMDPSSPVDLRNEALGASTESPSAAAGLTGSRIPSVSPVRTPVPASRKPSPSTVGPPTNVSPARQPKYTSNSFAASDPARLAPSPTRNVITPPGRRPVPYAADELPLAPPSPVSTPTAAPGGQSAPGLGFESHHAPGTDRSYTSRGPTTPLRLPSPSGKQEHRSLAPNVPATGLARHQSFAVRHQQSTPALRVPKRGLPNSAPAQRRREQGLRRAASFVHAPSSTGSDDLSVSRADGRGTGRQRIVTEPAGPYVPPKEVEHDHANQAALASLEMTHEGRTDDEGTERWSIGIQVALAMGPQNSSHSSNSMISIGHALGMLDNPDALSRPDAPVDAHTKDRIRLINHLSVLLGISRPELCGRFDILGLLVRVYEAYERTGDSGGADPVVVGEGKGKDGRGKKGVWGRFKRLGKKSLADTQAGTTASEGSVFGVKLYELPLASLCTTLIGGQRHDLPILIFTVIEAVYRRGMSQPGIFRLSGDPGRIGQLIKAFNQPLKYGDGLDLEWEPIHNLTGLVKRWLRDLPEPILDEALLSAFIEFCVGAEGDGPVSGSDDTRVSVQISATKIKAAQIMLKLLPPLHFSLLIFLLAFLEQLPHLPDNRLSMDSISTILGPAICAPRSKGIPGLGPASPVRAFLDDLGDSGSAKVVKDSQRVLAWLVTNWNTIKEGILGSIDELCSSSLTIKGDADYVPEFDPTLLSPVDIRARPMPLEVDQQVAHLGGGGSGVPFTATQHHGEDDDHKIQRINSERSWHSASSQYSDMRSPPAFASPQSHSDIGIAAAGHKRSHTSGSLLARALGTLSGATGKGKTVDLPRPESTTSLVSAATADGGKRKEPKRDNSYASLSKIFVRDVILPNRPKARSSVASTRPMKASGSRDSIAAGPEVANILDSLQDLLLSKDKQIARDARELAVLRHSLAEMEEKLKRRPVNGVPNDDRFVDLSDPLTPPSHGCACGHALSTPQITITDSASSPSALANTTTEQDRMLFELQAQLSTAMAALEASRQTNELQAARMRDLETFKTRLELEKEKERREMQTELASERAKVVGLTEERDVAKQRLERIKTTLFSVQ